MRMMTIADVDAVLNIEQAVQVYPWSRGNYTDALDSGYLCFVEEIAGEIAGYAVLMPGVEEAELLNIGVAASHQRQGMGGAMLSALCKVATDKQLYRLFLEVRASNLAALNLYRRAGFEQVGVRRGYYHDAEGSEDALVMACELSGKSNG
ncbi:MAG: ribosomal-protein-alanine N-acetyltransferase [Gallionellales bacterium RIFOXYB12_FULL_54_9]|nr:MAG: ribosomal-protein-alanine N-acetyltransferase [Gallionellales bacterium RIFOXYB12_FULL_54_9]